MGSEGVPIARDRYTETLRGGEPKICNACCRPATLSHEDSNHDAGEGACELEAAAAV